jgi:hypothetical protein
MNDETLVDTVQRTAQQLSQRELSTDVALVYFTHEACLPCRRLSAPLAQYFAAIASRVAVAQLDVTGCKAATLSLVGVSHLPCAQFYGANAELIETFVFSDLARLQAQVDLMLNNATQVKEEPISVSLEWLMDVNAALKHVHSAVAIKTDTLLLFGDEKEDEDDESDAKENVDVHCLLSRFVRVELGSQAVETIECSLEQAVPIDARDVSFVAIDRRLHAIVVARSGWHVLRWRRKARQWLTLTSAGMSECASVGVSFCGVNSMLYAFGGLFESGVASDALWRAKVSRSTVSWHAVPRQTMWPLARGHATLTAVADAEHAGLLLCGGDGGEPTFVEFGDGWLWQLDSSAWVDLSPTRVHAARMKHSAAVDARGAWLVGGESDFEPLEGAAAGAMFDLKRRLWRNVAFRSADESTVLTRARVCASGDGRVLVVDAAARRVHAMKLLIL